MDPFVAEIRMLGCNFPPKGWAFCNGQILPISQNTALFSLIGTTYGGNGTTNFALPNLQGQAVLSPGKGPGLSEYVMGEVVGTATVTLISGELAIHNHNVSCSTDGGDNASPVNTVLSSSGADRGAVMYSNATSGTLVAMNPAQLAFTGNGGPHNNMSPYVAMNYCIALQGIFPQRP